MNIKHVITVKNILLISTLLLAGESATASAQSGLPQIRQSLYQDPEADVTAPLQHLAERGDREAMRQLAEQLAQSDDPKPVMQAINWYERSFAHGRGSFAALAAMVQIADRLPLFRPLIRQKLDRDLPQADIYLDPASVQTALDILLVFPELLDAEDWQTLLRLHEQGCLENCRHAVYAGRHLEYQGQLEAARQSYQQAMNVDARAVSLFQNSYGEDDDARHQAMLAYATQQNADLAAFPPEPLTSIAMALSRHADSYDETIATWLNAAVESGSVDARIARVQMMMRLPGVFSVTDTLAEIDAVAALDPTEAQFLLAEAYMVKEWLSLDPAKARGILLTLELEHPVRVALALGQLYTMGGLDEPQPQQAVDLYQQLIEEHRSSIAYLRIATLYAGTPALCDQPETAWAYGQAALQLGQGGVRKLLSELATEISPEQRAKGELQASHLLATLEAQL